MSWQNLGVWTSTGTLNVTLGDAANGYVIANAVCLVPTSAPSAAPSVVDTGDPGYSESPNGGWQSYADSSAYNGDFRYHTPGSGSETAQWTFTGVNPADQYQVYATWSAAGNRASNAPYTISDGSTALASVNVNQQQSPSDALIDGQEYESLGVYTASSGTFNIGLSDNANGIVVANAIRIVQIQPAATPSIVDNSDAGFVETGSGWQGYNDPSAVNGSFRYCAAGSGSNTAQWTFNGVQPLAQYRSTPPGRPPETGRRTPPTRFPTAVRCWPPST